ncbi:hypothetical protein UPYG_G00332550 [Umbra pygmaea]|uniref:Uncharacterized protein n=1 Tax=Umbra pygmaea TaxID=75934 RepID=A0ABD0W9Y0_UMBPY
MPVGIFSTWNHHPFNPTAYGLTNKINNNPSYPFTSQNDVFVFEYLHENLWKGSLLLIASIIGSACHMNIALRDHDNYVGLLVFTMLLSLWFICTGAFRRRLVVDHNTNEYRFYINRKIRHVGPLNQIYIRMIRQMTGIPGKKVPVYKLVLSGHRIEKRELSGVSDNYEMIESYGKGIAKEINLNYFDYLDVSKHHHVVHRPNNNLSDMNDTIDSSV